MSPVVWARRLDVRQSYELWALHYDSDPNVLLALEERCFPASTLEVHDKDVVELGCGTGRWLHRLEESCPRSLTGIDVSEGMLAEARAKCAPSTVLIQGDCLRIPLADCIADCVLSSFMLSHLCDLRRFAAEVDRICRSGATIVITDLHPDTASYGWRQTFRSSKGLIEIEAHPYRLDQLIDAMEGAGCSLQYMAERCFEEEDAAIFQRLGKAHLFQRVAGLPVIYRAWFQKNID